MYSQFALRVLCLVSAVLCTSAAVLATTPVIIVTSPVTNSQTLGPVHYIASASSPECAKGIASMEIYSAPYVVAYHNEGGSMNGYINLQPGTYNTVVQSWDQCGGVAKSDVTITVTGETPPAGFVYTVNSDYSTQDTTNDVVGFTIVAADGSLAATGQGPVQANVDPIAVASDSGGYRLYVGDFVSGDVFPYFIDRSNGYIFPVPGAPFPVDRSVTAVAVHPSGNLIFATRDEEAAGDGIAVFDLQSDGSLRAAPGSPYSTQIGPQALVVDPGGKYLYVADYSGYIDAFSINASASTLTPLPGSPYRLTANCGGSAQMNPNDMLELSGQYLYTADLWGDAISGFSIGDGTLSEISGSPYCLNFPSSLAVDGTGKFLYARTPDNNGTMHIAIYSIGSKGELTFIKQAGPSWNQGICDAPMRTDAGGNYLYTGICGGSYNGLLGFSINHATGDLTELPTSPYLYPVKTIFVTMQDIAVTP
jgi:6-phosphogluconolactonase (cycloisomerase 2 family)